MLDEDIFYPQIRLLKCSISVSDDMNYFKLHGYHFWKINMADFMINFFKNSVCQQKIGKVIKTKDVTLIW